MFLVSNPHEARETSMQAAAENVLHDVLGWAVDPLAAGLEALCDRTGLRWGPTTDRSLFFFRSPFMHVVEFVVFHVFVYITYKLSEGYFAASYGKGRGKGMPRSLLNTVLGIIFFLCWVSQVYLKAVRPNPLVQLCWLAMPCHLITLLWVYILLSPPSKRNYRLCVYLASMITGCHWGPTSAAASPDWSDHQYPVEGYIFVLHHGLLVAMPVYFAARFELLPLTFRYVWHVTWVATLINVNAYTLLSYISGLNINYHLYPPIKLIKLPIFDTPFYRFYVIAALIVLTVLFRLAVGGAASHAARVAFGSQRTVKH